MSRAGSVINTSAWRKNLMNDRTVETLLFLLVSVNGVPLKLSLCSRLS